MACGPVHRHDRVEHLAGQPGDPHLAEPGVTGAEQAHGELVGQRARGFHRLQAQREHGGLGGPDPDGQAARAVALVEQDDVLAAERVVVLAAPDVGDRYLGPGGAACRCHDGLLGGGERLRGAGGRLRRAGQQRHQRGGERGAGLVQPGFHRTDRDGKLRGYLTMGEALQVEQENGIPLAVGELSHRGPDSGRQVGQFRTLVGAWLRRCPVECPVQCGRPFRPELAHPAPGHVERDPAEPGAEPARCPEPVQADQRRDGGFLGGIGGQVRRAQHPGRERDGGGPVPGHQGGEGVLVAVQGGPDQLLVGKLAGQAVVHIS